MNVTTASDVFVDCLVKYNVKEIFGIPGEANPYFVRALSKRKEQIKMIVVRHEQGAAFMAYGVSVANHYNGIPVPGVCLSTEGPGATNLLTALACATEDRIPLIAITGQTARASHFKRGFQNIDVLGMTKPITKWSVTVTDPSSIQEVLAQAFRLALTPPRGVVHIELPLDVSNLEMKGELSPLPISLDFPVVEPDQGRLQYVYKAIREAKRPIILAGPSLFTRLHGESIGWQELRKFVAHTKIGLVAAPGGKGAFSGADLQYLSALNFPPRDWANYALEWADYVIAIGYDQAEYGTADWNQNRTPIIHIDHYPAGVSWTYQPLEREIVGDIGKILSGLNKLAEKDNWEVAYDLQHKVRTEFAFTLSYVPPDAKEGYVFQGHLSYAIGAFMRDLKEDGLVVLDSGAHQTWILRNVEFESPCNLISSNSMASMGIGLPAALGVARANVEAGKPKKVLVVTGDGGFLMNATEMATLAHLFCKQKDDVKVVVIVWNDSALGFVEWAETQNVVFAGSHGDLSLANPDFEALGNSFGWKGLKEVTKIDDFKATLTEAFEGDRSAIFSVRVDTEQNAKFSNKLIADIPKAIHLDQTSQTRARFA